MIVVHHKQCNVRAKVIYKDQRIVSLKLIHDKEYMEFFEKLKDEILQRVGSVSDFVYLEIKPVQHLIITVKEFEEEWEVEK